MLHLSELTPEALWLPSTEGYFLILPFSISVLWLNLQMPPTLATSFFFPSNLPWAFPNCSAPHLCPPSSDPESTDLRKWLVQSSENCEDTLPIKLCSGTEMNGWMVLWEKFLSSNQSLSSLYHHTPIPGPEGVICSGWLTGRVWSQTSAVWPKPSLAFWPILECFSVWELLLTVSPPGLSKA